MRQRELDGIRTLAISLVIAGHARLWFEGAGPRPWWLEALTNHRLGVSVFFVLSGFLITRLLRQEWETHGGIRLDHFYARRALRIVPAFAVYLLALVALRVPVPGRELTAAALFFWNYLPHADCWWVGHTWSLAVEEQFYVLWPTLFRTRNLALFVFAAAPALRLITYATLPMLRDRLGFLGHTQLDLLMCGASVALWSRPRKVPAMLAAAAALFVFLGSPLMSDWLRSAYALTMRNTFEGACLGTLLLWILQNGRSLAARALSAGPIAYLGRISYGIYLWQQLFVHPSNPLRLGLPAAIAATLAVAALSHHLVEQPLIALGARFRRDPPRSAFPTRGTPRGSRPRRASGLPGSP